MILRWCLPGCGISGISVSRQLPGPQDGWYLIQVERQVILIASESTEEHEKIITVEETPVFFRGFSG